MAQIQKIPDQEAIVKWNDFAISFHSNIPFSFNPSLFYFYTRHFKWKPYYFLLFKENKLCGLFPLVDTGRSWVSLPHFSYGGFINECNDSNFVPSILIDQLIDEVRSTGPASGFYHVALNGKLETKGVNDKIFVRSLENYNDNRFLKSEKLTSTMELPTSIEKLTALVSTNLNRKIRKAKQSGITIKNGGSELLADFYQVYSKNIYKLRSLNYPVSFFTDLLKSYDFGEISFFVAYHKNRPVGSALLMGYLNFYENPYFATTTSSRKHYVSDLMHFEMMSHLVVDNQKRKFTDDQTDTLEGQEERNPKIYSFGRSTDSSGVHKYKSHWPVNDSPLYNYTNFQDLRKYSWLLNLWGILPIAISRPLGARLIKHIY